MNDTGSLVKNYLTIYMRIYSGHSILFHWSICLYLCQYHSDSLVAQMVKRLPTMWETWVWSLGGEDPLEKEMAPHSSTLAWKIPWTEEPGRLQSMGSQRVGHDWGTKHCLLILIVSDEISGICFVLFFLNYSSPVCICLLPPSTFYLILLFSSLTVMYVGGVFFVFFLLGIL